MNILIVGTPTMVGRFAMPFPEKTGYATLFSALGLYRLTCLKVKRVKLPNGTPEN